MSTASTGNVRERRAIRRRIREQRRSLSRDARRGFADSVARILCRPGVLPARCQVACYLPNDGELDLRPLMARLWRRGTRTSLPVLDGPRLRFLPFGPHTPLRPNRFGIPEPACSPRRRIATFHIDVVLVPLVAFDGRGNRLGMGGGFYDRTFAHRRRLGAWRRPLLIGVAYGFQRVASLSGRVWDVSLDGAATEKGLVWFRGSESVDREGQPGKIPDQPEPGRPDGAP